MAVVVVVVVMGVGVGAGGVVVGMEVVTGADVVGVGPGEMVVGGPFSRPRSDLIKLLSTISSSNLRRLIDREELLLGVRAFLYKENNQIYKSKPYSAAQFISVSVIV